jgi:hypothetical protein
MACGTVQSAKSVGPCERLVFFMGKLRKAGDFYFFLSKEKLKSSAAHSRKGIVCQASSFQEEKTSRHFRSQSKY